MEIEGFFVGGCYKGYKKYIWEKMCCYFFVDKNNFFSSFMSYEVLDKFICNMKL